MEVAAFRTCDASLHVAGIKLPAHLEYADNIMLLSQPTAAQHLLDATHTTVAPLGLHIVPAKLSCLVFSPVDIAINGQPVPSANPANFHVLGFWLAPDTWHVHQHHLEEKLR